MILGPTQRRMHPNGITTGSALLQDSRSRVINSSTQTTLRQDIRQDV